LFFLERRVVYDLARKHTINKKNTSNIDKRLKQASITNGLVETIAWTPRTLKTELGRKRYGFNKVQGLDCEENYFPGAYLHENRDLNIIMCINRRADMLKIKGGPRLDNLKRSRA
jgi:hypothetical protein